MSVVSVVPPSPLQKLEALPHHRACCCCCFSRKKRCSILGLLCILLVGAEFTKPLNAALVDVAQLAVYNASTMATAAAAGGGGGVVGSSIATTAFFLMPVWMRWALTVLIGIGLLIAVKTDLCVHASRVLGFAGVFASVISDSAEKPLGHELAPLIFLGVFGVFLLVDKCLP
eukprot:GHVS01052993.1.p1 GENE.GHVS01052993.1~~GHVS01052993.1.p1  ORF type:complete len:172 (+),score=29.20 GHVS01052993.1:182-697(+)